MLKVLKNFFAGLILAATVQTAAAFSMLGPLDANFQTSVIGYSIGNDIGGPMNLGEEYRWNVPSLTYAFDESFLNYFGSGGVAAVDKAVEILNGLPNMDDVTTGVAGDPNLYVNGVPIPAETTLVNYQAQALRLRDLRSTTLHFMMEELGLAEPTRWTWCLRAKIITAVTNYQVIKRNFDPVTLAPSSFVNGVLYTYIVRQSLAPDIADAAETPSDPFAIRATAVADVGSGPFDPFIGPVVTPGEFFFGLTRDDIGGLRYLYRNNNFNRENLLPGTTAFAVRNPYDPWYQTNVVATANTAMRPGIQKISFSKLPLDSLLGQTILVTNRYTDIYNTNGVWKSQSVQRVSTAPDIIFAADDLGQNIVTRTGTGSWQNNDAINGSGITLAGPGVIAGNAGIGAKAVITFNKVGPYLINGPWPNFLTEGEASPQLFWGSWDGIDDTPVVYPIGTSIQDWEQQLFGP